MAISVPGWGSSSASSRYSAADMVILAHYGVHTPEQAAKGNWVVLNGRGYQIVQVGASLSSTPASSLNRTSPTMEADMVSGENRLIPTIYGRVHVGGRLAVRPLFNGSTLVLVPVWGLGPNLGVEQVFLSGLANLPGVVVRNYPGMAKSRTVSCTITGSNTITSNAGHLFLGLQAPCYIQFTGFANAANNANLLVSSVDPGGMFVTISATLVNETATVWWKQGVDALLQSLIIGFSDNFVSPAEVSPPWAASYSVIQVPANTVSGFPLVSAIIQGRFVRLVESAYVELNGTSQSISTPSSSTNQLNEDFEIVAHVAADDWTPAAEKVITSKWNITGNQRAYRFTLQTTGALRLEVSVDGTAVKTYTSASNLSALAAGARKVVRVRYTKNNGANSVASFATSEDGQYWTALGADQTGTTSATIFASTASLIVGADAAGGWFDGKVYTIKVRSTAKAPAEFQVLDLEVRATTFTDGNGVVWTLNGSAFVNDHTNYSLRPVNHLIDFIRDRTSGPGRFVDQDTALRVYDLNVMQVGTPAEDLCEANNLISEQVDTDMWVDVLRDYAHCFAVLEGDTYYLIRDWDDPAVASFDSSNIIENSFLMKTLGSRNVPTEVDIVFSDRTSLPWKEGHAVQYRSGVRSGTLIRRVSKVQRLGTSRFSEADRASKERINNAYYNNSVVSFITTDIGALTRVGDPITVSFPFEAGNVTNTIDQVRYLVTSMTPSAAPGGRWSVTARRHDARRFSQDVATQPPGPITTLPSPALPPAIIMTSDDVSENLYQLADGTWSSQIRVQWTHDSYPFVDFYWIEIYEGGVEPENLRHTGVSHTTNYFTPPLKEKVQYTVKVFIRSTAGVLGTAAQVTFTPIGKFVPPSWPVGAVLSGFEVGGRVLLYWPKAVDVDTVRYIIKYKKVSESPTYETANQLTTIDSTTYTVEGLSAGSYRFYVEALDTVGNVTGAPLQVDIVVTTDNSSFQTLTFRPTSWKLTAATRFFEGSGKEFAVTDWADPVAYGHTTLSNAVGNMDDGLGLSSFMTQPHSQSLCFNKRTGTKASYVRIPYVAGLAMTSAGSWDCWIFPFDSAENDTVIFSTYGTTGPAGHFSLLFGTNGGAGTNRVYTTGVTAIDTGNNAIIPNTWNHICLTWSTATWRLYVNGVEKAFTTGGGTNVNNATNWAIGTRASGGADVATYGFRGLINRNRLWTVALTAAEVLRLIEYNSTNVTTVINSGGLVAANLKSVWNGVDGGQGSVTTAYVDTKAVSNGLVLVGAGIDPDWRSWDEVESDVIDLGQIYSGLFEIVNGPQAIFGVTRVNMLLSNDGVSYNPFTGESTRASGRFVKFSMQSEGGSAKYNLSDAGVAVSLVPKEEYGEVSTVAGLTPGGTGLPTPAIVTLSGDYAQALSIQLTPKFTSASTVRIADYDQVEVSFGRGMPSGRALRFTGVSGSAAGNYVRVGDHAEYTFGNGATDLPFTAECWVKFDTIGAVQTFFGKGTGLPSGEWQLRVKADGRIAALFIDLSATALVTVQSLIPFAPGVWYHVAMTYNGSGPLTAGNVKIYINGNEEPTGITSSGTYTAMENTAEELIFGNQYNAGTYNSPLSGVLDDIRIWNDVRTAQEILDNMQAVLVGNEANLVGLWRLDETSGYTANDDCTAGGHTARDGTLGTGTVFNNQVSTATTSKWWRPIDGFDVYCRDQSNNFVVAVVKYLFKGM